MFAAFSLYALLSEELTIDAKGSKELVLQIIPVDNNVDSQFLHCWMLDDPSSTKAMDRLFRDSWVRYATPMRLSPPGRLGCTIQSTALLIPSTGGKLRLSWLSLCRLSSKVMKCSMYSRERCLSKIPLTRTSSCTEANSARSWPSMVRHGTKRSEPEVSVPPSPASPSGIRSSSS